MLQCALQSMVDEKERVLPSSLQRQNQRNNKAHGEKKVQIKIRSALAKAYEMMIDRFGVYSLFL